MKRKKRICDRCGGEFKRGQGWLGACGMKFHMPDECLKPWPGKEEYALSSSTDQSADRETAEATGNDPE